MQRDSKRQLNTNDDHCLYAFLSTPSTSRPPKNRLDQILGKQGSKSKDVYASKISLASRVVKIERQVS